MNKKPFYQTMIFQLLAAIVLGALAGSQIQAHHASALGDWAKIGVVASEVAKRRAQDIRLVMRA